MTATAVVGCTGLVGSYILSTLLAESSVGTVAAFTRRALDVDDPNSRLRPVVDSDSSNWAADYSSLSPRPELFLSSIGTTRANAGGLDNQRKIDLDLNLDLARAAKEGGARVYVLISSSGASTSSYFPYFRMKGELVEAVEKIGFEKTIIVKPGLIVGTRSESRPAEYIMRLIASFMGKISGGYLKNFWAQDADDIGRAAVRAGLKALEGSAPEGPTWHVEQGDIVRIGKTESN